ncbi:hypothetical protein R3X25_00225 [Lutibacter sp. TH_r2]|uniref:hypothetical protein n=1 Tax=Lutibacter sp. TH_r2 TaxID=3082083 RepID=UPI002954E4DF|nr:hypothetical protein [Lutibacter sp. TH_r2]MDV7185689.1 hypothetical protein [Lutibacter sp. TH_r2]
MRTVNTTIIALILLFISISTYAQTNKSITVENIPENEVWTIVYKTFKDLNLKYPFINKQLGEGKTNFFHYATMLAKNRAKYKITYSNSILTISIVDRQYLSKSTWVDNLLPISKKQTSKLLLPIKQHILKLLADKNYSHNNIATKNNTTTDNHKGVYKDFAISKTKNNDLQLLSFHKNGNILGIGLNNNNTSLNSLVFQQTADSEKTTMLFDEKGYPKSIITNQFILNIKALNNTEAEISIYKTNGDLIKTSTTLLDNFETFSTTLHANKTQNGPSIFEINHQTEVSEPISTALGYAATAIKAVTCAASLTTVVGALVPCTALLLDVMQRLSDEEAFYYDELVVIDKVFGLIPFNNPLQTVANIGTLIDGMNYVVEGSTNLYNTLFPEGELIITGLATINAGSFGEFGDEKLTLYAKSNYSETQIEWNSLSDNLDLYSYIKKGDENYKEEYSGAIYRAKETKSDNNYIEVKQIIDEKTITFKKKVTIINPNYYYFPWPDCGELYDTKIINDDEAEKCLNQQDDCIENLPKNDIILANEPKIIEAILKEHVVGGSVLTDPSIRLNSNKLNMIRKLWKEDGSPYTGSEAGEFRSFVKIAPCMANWSGIEEKRQIIILVHEALLKIEAKETKIKELQKVANETNYQKIAVDIKNIENSIEPIKTACAEKVKKIAEKRTITYQTKKTDPDGDYYTISGAEIMGFKWGKYGGPSLEMEIFFTPKRTIKTVKQFNRTLKFHQDLSQFSFSFEDGSDKPLQYALIINNKIRNEGIVKTTLRIKDFEKDIKTLNFYLSNAKATKIN